MREIGLTNKFGQDLCEGQTVRYIDDYDINKSEHIGIIEYRNEEARFIVKPIKTGIIKYLDDDPEYIYEDQFEFYDGMGECFNWTDLEVIDNVIGE